MVTNQQMDQCPRCDEPVYCIVKQIGQPTKYFHSRNNQEDVIHEDLSANIPETKKLIHAAHSVDRYPLCMPPEYWTRNTNLNFRASKDDDEVTCEKCKAILTQMYREIGKQNG